MLDWLYTFFITPLHHTFMQNVLFSIIFICVTCGIISTFLVLKGWSLYGDAISHAVLPGIILALSFALPVAFGVFLIAIIVTFTIQYFTRETVYHEQTVLSFVTSAFMGVGLLLYYTNPPGIRIKEILFGKIVGQTTQDVIWLGLVTLAVVLVIRFTWRTMSLVFFDRIFAKIIGIRIFFYEAIFYALIAVSVMTSLRTVGSLLVVSLLIVPGSLGYVLTKELKYIFFISTGYSVVTGVIGMYLSYHYQISTGASIITMQFTGFLIIFSFKYIGRRLFIAQRKKDLQDANEARAEAEAAMVTKEYCSEAICGCDKPRASSFEEGLALAEESSEGKKDSHRVSKDSYYSSKFKNNEGEAK